MIMRPDDPQISSWFWELLESSDRRLRTLCRRLEQLPPDQLRAYRRQFDEAKEFVNPCYREEFGPHLTDTCSEDRADDFSAWVVSQGRDFYERVRADPASIGRYLHLFDEAEGEGESPLRWDQRVDRDEYRGYQRADYIATPVYRLWFGEDLDGRGPMSDRESSP